MFTVATFALPVDHATVRPVSVLPFASFKFAENCCVLPVAMLAVLGETVTDATGVGPVEPESQEPTLHKRANPSDITRQQRNDIVESPLVIIKLEDAGQSRVHAATPVA